MAKHSQIKLKAALELGEYQEMNYQPAILCGLVSFCGIPNLSSFALHAANVIMLMSAEMTARDTRGMTEIWNALTKP